MAAYIQMGHASESLIVDPGLQSFEGIVLSPVNRSPEQLKEDVQEFRSKGQFDVILDPQLYYPRNQRRHLPSQPYFPNDFDTADFSSVDSWRRLGGKVALYSRELKVDAACSPAVIPNRWTSDYYSYCIESFCALRSELKDGDPRPIFTLSVRLKELSDPNDAFRIASMVTTCQPESCYLVVEAELEPRREIKEADNIASLMVLIAALQRSGCSVLVSHCSSEMILLKAAGASACATGKFFNLRRFTPGRFDDEEDGGRLIPYWFEHSLLAFLREADIARIRRNVNPDFIGQADSGNIYGQQILTQFIDEPGKPWVGLSWRQYLAWFAAVEGRLSGREAPTIVDRWLREAEQRWLELEDKGALLEEIRNDGSWVRRWRQALSDFLRVEY